MPSKKKQHNIRLSDDQEARFQAVRLRMQQAVNLELELTVTDVFVAALAELEKRYSGGDPPAVKARGSKGGKAPAAAETATEPAEGKSKGKKRKGE